MTSYPTLTRFLARFHMDWMYDHAGGWRSVMAEANATISRETRSELLTELEELASSDQPDDELLTWVLARGDGFPASGDLERGSGIKGSLMLMADALREQLNATG